MSTACIQVTKIFDFSLAGLLLLILQQMMHLCRLQVAMNASQAGAAQPQQAGPAVSIPSASQYPGQPIPHQYSTQPGMSQYPIQTQPDIQLGLPQSSSPATNAALYQWMQTQLALQAASQTPLQPFSPAALTNGGLSNMWQPANDVPPRTSEARLT